MSDDIEYRRQVVEKYKPDVVKLTRYLPWLIQKKGGAASSIYGADGIAQHSISFPVYDSTLLGFVKEAQSTQLMNRNYTYVYSKHGIRTTADELRFIEIATMKEFEDLGGILSKHIMGGMTKGKMWSDAVENGLFLACVTKMKELLEFWDKPFDDLETRLQ